MPGTSARSRSRRAIRLRLLREMGATPEEVKAITTAFGARGRTAAPGRPQAARAACAGERRQRLQPVRVIIATDTTIEAMVAWSEMGKYVAVDVRSANSVASSASDDDDDDGKGVRLYQSIYETALRNQVPRPVIDEPDPHLLLRRRLPAQGPARRLLRDPVCRRG